MAYRILGQVAPTANSLSALYSPGLEQQTVVSSLKICNRSSSPTTFTIAILGASATLSDKHYVYYSHPLPPNRTFSAVEGWTLAPGEQIQVSSANGQCSFSLFGNEINT